MSKLGDKILIIGCAGSGKTTLSKKLHAITGIPIVHMDRYYWTKDWDHQPDDQWNETVKRLCQKPTWIMDGNYTKTMAYRFKYASSVIYLDIPRWGCLFRAIIRRFRFYIDSNRDDLPPDCNERIDFAFYRWIWNYPKRSRNQALLLLHQHEGPVYHLRSTTDIYQFIKSLADEP